MGIVTLNTAKKLVPPEAVIRFQGGSTSLTISSDVYIAFLDASSSSDPDGTISSYIWEYKLNSGVWYEIGSSTVSTFQKTTKVSGTYQFRVKVIDNDGLENYSNTITLNFTKVVSSDIEANINGETGTYLASIYIYDTLQLSAENSYKGSGATSIVSYSWEVLNGPGAYAFTSFSNPVTTFTPHALGTYAVELTIMNDLGDTDYNIVNITVSGTL